MPSITKVPILERASDITRVSCSLSSELSEVVCIDPSIWARQEELVSKGTSAFHLYQFSIVKQGIKYFQINHAPS